MVNQRIPVIFILPTMASATQRFAPLMASVTSGDVMNTGHVTSAVPGMPVANVRKGLATLRDMWKHRTPNTPLFISDLLIADMSIQEFCTCFTLGQHMKRHAKSSVHRASAAMLAAAASSTAVATTLPGPPPRAFTTLIPALLGLPGSLPAAPSAAALQAPSSTAAQDVITVSGTRNDTIYVLTRAHL